MRLLPIEISRIDLLINPIILSVPSIIPISMSILNYLGYLLIRKGKLPDELITLLHSENLDESVNLIR